MNKNKLDSYRKNQAASSPREIEATALTIGAQKLLDCRDNWNSENRRELLEEALKFNQKLWTIFQADLGGAENALPTDLKLNLLRLSAYVDKQIFHILAHPSPEKLTSIININFGIAKGLRGQTSSYSNESGTLRENKEGESDSTPVVRIVV